MTTMVAGVSFLLLVVNIISREGRMALLLVFLPKVHRIKRPHDIIAEQKKYYEQG